MRRERNEIPMSLERLLDLTNNPLSPEELYTEIRFPPPPEKRPYVYINMAATVDGKIVIGEAGGTAKGVGGPTDQKLFRRLQTQCDAALLGSATIRAGQVIYPRDKARYAVTRTGDVPLNNRFFTDAPERAFILAPENLPPDVRKRLQDGANLIQIGAEKVDLPAALQWMQREHDLKVLLCEGGATLNDDLIRAWLADELFLTLAPKLKGGSHLPTIMTGIGFPPGQSTPLNLLSIYRDEAEIYLRYRFAAAEASKRPS